MAWGMEHRVEGLSNSEVGIDNKKSSGKRWRDYLISDFSEFRIPHSEFVNPMPSAHAPCFKP
jgi:hypothetical protein